MSDEAEARRNRVVRDTSMDHLRQYVESDGREGYTMRGVPTLVLTTTGRRSGEPRSAPLMFGRDGENYVMVASLGGSSTDPYWSRNLCADPEVGLQVKAQHLHGRARVARGDERARLWRMMSAVFPTYDSYQARTDREIPVVVVEPESSAPGR
jgi:deazaflavin-dependent oxidoreductase (nitroreductase family)